MESYIVKSINIEGPIIGIRYPVIKTTKANSVKLTARNVYFNNITFKWTPSIGLDNANIKSPTFNFLNDQDYQIQIISISGCSTTDSQYVKVITNIDIIVPKAFTPNGDGHNDFLQPVLLNVLELKYFRVFDRWGKIVFETNDLNKSWDGTYKGIKQPMDTYTWSCQGLDANGVTLGRSGQSVLIR